MSLLSIKNLDVGYGGIKAVKGIDIKVDAGELVTLIGANGAGKTTTLKAITGLLHPTQGSIEYDGGSIVGKAAHDIAAQGLVLVPEGRGVFPGLTIEENLQMGAYTRSDRQEIAADIEHNVSLFQLLK